MTLTEAELSERLENLDLTECGFCHRPIAPDEVLAAGEAHDGSAKVTGFCCLGHLASIWCCEIPENAAPHLAEAFISAYKYRKAGLELGRTYTDGTMTASTIAVEKPQLVGLPGWYLDDEVLEYAEFQPRENWLPELVAAAQVADSEGKQLAWITWPDGVQVALATFATPADDLVVRAYRKAAATLMTHLFSGQEAQS